MAQSKFTIPPEFQSKLRVVASLDTRTDGEIIKSISKYQPVTSEKNIWAFWHSGIQSMPPWTQRNLISMARINGPSWTIRVLDSVPDSPTNALKYVPVSYLPDSFVNGTMTGPYTGPHSSDFLRGATLYLYGGVYLDVGIIPIAPLDFICWNALSDPSTPYNVAVPVMYTQTIANHFVAARKSDPFIKRWHDLFIHLWADKTEHTGLMANPLLHLGENIEYQDSQDAGFAWDFKVEPAFIFEYITQVICWIRLCMLEPPDNATGEDTFNTSAYWLKHILPINVLPENWAAEATVGFSENGNKVLKCLTTRLDADPNSPEYKEAYKLVWRLLTKSSMQKVVHGKGLTNDVSLGYLLDQPENQMADCEEGTFAELLRYGAVHFRQTREGPVLLEAKPCKKIVKKGLFEA